MAEVLLIGSGNPNKARELGDLLLDLPWDVRGLADFPAVPEPVEDQDTFEGNAAIKATYYAQRFGVWCLGDDSGLVVDALDGAPGVYSARYAGPDCDDGRNCAKLLEALRDVPEAKRTARFVCCAAIARPDGETHLERGVVEGHVGFEPRGHNGFGYDPLFLPEGAARTFAEMADADKHAISHRGRALGKVRAYLAGL